MESEPQASGADLERGRAESTEETAEKGKIMAD
jgi:hypothetical protein